MQDQRNGRPPVGLPDPDSREYRAQKVVLLELVVTPPEEGDRVDDLVDRLPVGGRAVGPAIVALEAAGLAERSGDVVRASAAALYFEHLWPHALTRYSTIHAAASTASEVTVRQERRLPPHDGRSQPLVVRTAGTTIVRRRGWLRLSHKKCCKSR
jgi:hypothetical protein